MATQLSVRLRPKRLRDYLGQPAAVAFVRGMAKSHSAPNLILISGPSGTGKTTLARLVGSLLTGWREDPDNDPDQREIPANVERSIESVRALIDFARLMPRVGRRRIIIVDEAHGYVGPAASALLKATEDPPRHATWIFCTDQPWKLNKALVSRAISIALRLAPDEAVLEMLQSATETIGARLNDKALSVIVGMSHGSMRVALQLLESVHTAMLGGATVRDALQLAVETANAVDGFDAALQFLEAALAGDSRKAILALGASTGDGVLEILTGMLSGLIRKSCGSRPKDGLGYAAASRIRRVPELPVLLEFQARVATAIHMRASSDYAVPADAVLFALARSSR